MPYEFYYFFSFLYREAALLTRVQDQLHNTRLHLVHCFFPLQYKSTTVIKSTSGMKEV